MNGEQRNEIRKFYDDFSKRVGEKVNSLEMVSLKANSTAFEALHLTKKFTADEIWGLFVFCEKSLYFFVNSWESAMSIMFRQAVHGSEPEEQILNFSEIKDLKFEKQQKKWYDFLFGGSQKLVFRFVDSNNETQRVFVTTHHKSEEVYKKICGLGYSVE